MSGDEKRCAETTCNSPVVMEHGFCFRHSPDPADQALAAAASMRGAATTKAKRRRGLDADELGPLKTPADAQVWAERIGLAAASGRLSGTAAQAALRALAEWRSAYDLGAMADRLAALERATTSARLRVSR